MRLDRNLEADISGIYQNKEGDTGNDVWGKRSAWVVLNGKIKDEKISIAIIDHPENPNYPGWSHAREYGLFAINNLGGRCFDKQAEKVQIIPYAPRRVEGVRGGNARPFNGGRAASR